MWADYFEALGTPSESATYDNGFAALVSAHVKETVEACLDDPGGILNEPLTYDEIANVCSKMKPGVCGVLLDYKHIRYAGPPLWNLLFILYQECFCQFSVSKNIKKLIILPLFKGKGAKANNKDSYRGITLFLAWIRGSKERSRSSQNSRPQDERAKRAKGEEPLVTLDHNLVLEPVRLHVKLLCQDKRGGPI